MGEIALFIGAESSFEDVSDCDCECDAEDSSDPSAMMHVMNRAVAFLSTWTCPSYYLTVNVVCSSTAEKHC